MKLQQLHENAQPYLKIKNFLEEESGMRVVDMKIHPDPEVPNVYAVRVQFDRDPSPVDIVINTDQPDQFEETTFDQWPPRQAKQPNPFY